MDNVSRVLYPDSGGMLDDASIIRNTLYFSTEARAYSAELVLKEYLNVSQRKMDFMVVRAFEEYMTSTEDLLAWLFALKEWKPGGVEDSLLVLLVKKIKVGSRDYSEKKAVELLESVDAEGFREMFHIPKEEELIDFGISKQFVDNIRTGIPAKLNGWLRIARDREEQKRGRVRMFNKMKHHMIVFPVRKEGKDLVWVPTRLNMDDIEEKGIGLESGPLEANLNKIRKYASNAIVAQAVLHDTLAIILITRYGEKHKVQDWVLRAYENYW